MRKSKVHNEPSEKRTVYEELTQAAPDDTPHGEGQKFIRNSRYFTISIYAFVLVVLSTIAIKLIVSFESTKALFNGLGRAFGPFLIALLIAYILTPFVRVVNKLLHRVFKRLPDKPAMVISLMIVYLTAVGLIVAMLIYILPEVTRNIVDLASYIPEAYNQLTAFLETLQERFPALDFSSITSMLNNTESDLISGLTNITTSLIPVLYTASVSVVTWFANFVIAMVVSVYMLYGKKSLKRIFKIILYALVPTAKAEKIKELVRGCNTIFSQYVVSKMIDSLIIGILCAILMTILRLPYIFLISLVVGVTNMIPYFGPFIGAIPGAVIQLVISPLKALVFLIMILCLQQFDGLVLGPKLMGNSTGMKPIWIIFAITIGGKFFGIAGMFLGVPVLAILAYLGGILMEDLLERKNINIEDIQ